MRCIWRFDIGNPLLAELFIMRENVRITDKLIYFQLPFEANKFADHRHRRDSDMGEKRLSLAENGCKCLDAWFAWNMALE